ncbi:MAG: lipopolysaccharide heptosyltransferase II, partial [Victivallaceae bacterium]
MKSGNKFKVLIVKPSSLGDLFHVFPAISILTAAHPDVEIDWVVHPAFADVLKYCPNIRRIIIFKRKELGSIKTFLPNFIKLFAELRKEHYDLVIDFQGLFRSALFASLTKCRTIAGFASPKEPAAKFFYTRKITVPASAVHAVDKNVSLMQMLLKSQIAPAAPSLTPVKEFAEKTGKLFAECSISHSSRIVGIIPGARWHSKCWPPAFFVDIINAAHRLNPEFTFLILGSRSDRHAAEEIMTAANRTASVISLAGKTGIGELVEAIRRCEFIISNDSGPIHIAAAMNKPVFAFFGPTDHLKTGPYGAIHSIFQADLPGIKCLKRKCPLGTLDCHKLEISKITDKLSHFINNGAANENAR